MNTNKQRQNKINRINDDNVNDVFEQFNIDAFEVSQIYKQFVRLIHFDKQSDSK